VSIPLNSGLTLTNDSKPDGEDWWEWSVWVEGSDEELSRVESVTYRLHPTFAQPLQTVDDRASKFRLRGSGWGEFAIRAEAKLRGGGLVALDRWLELRDAQGKRPSDDAGAGGRKPTVFISASAIDGEFVAELTDALGEQGIEARSQQDVIEPGSDFKDSAVQALEGADGVVVVFSDSKSPWVEKEFERARTLRKPTFPVIVGDSQAPVDVSSMVRYELKERRNAKGLANAIASRLKDALIPEELK